MLRPHLRALAAVVMVGAVLSVPAVGASGSTGSTGSASTFIDGINQIKLVVLQTRPLHDGFVAATGSIHAQGTDVVINDSKDKFQFPDGNVLVKHSQEGKGTESFDPVTCYFTFTEKGTWKTYKGSGAYANVQGSGTYKVRTEGFGCYENQAPVAFFVKIVAKGELTY